MIPEPTPAEPPQQARRAYLCPLHEVAAWVEAHLPGARFRGVTARGWPVVGGVRLSLGYRVGPGTVWYCPRAGWWMWEPVPGT